MSYLLAFLIVSFEKQKGFYAILPNFDRVSFISVFFGCYALGVRSSSLLPNPKSQRLFSPAMFSFKGLIISALTFRSLVYFELVFVYRVILVGQLHYFAVVSSCLSLIC